MSDNTLPTDPIARRQAIMTQRAAIVTMPDADRTDADYSEYDALGRELGTLLPPGSTFPVALPSFDHYVDIPEAGDH